MEDGGGGEMLKTGEAFWDSCLRTTRVTAWVQATRAKQALSGHESGQQARFRGLILKIELINKNTDLDSLG